MRITDSMLLTDTLTSEARASQQMYDLTNEASTGLKINAPSDDPAGYASVVSADARIAVLQARSSAATNASGDLNLADGVLSSASDILVQAKQIAVVAADGTQSAADRANAATQLTQLRQQLIGLGNTQGSNGYLFGGTKTDTPPFDANGNFTGNDGVTQMEVADGVLAQTNVSGAKAFTAAGGNDVIGDLQTLVTALSANNVAAIQTSVGQLDADNSQMIDARVNAGAASERLQSSSQVIQTALITDQTSRANVADADVAQVYSQLTAVQTSYQAAISVNKQVLTMLQQTMQLA
jgi:flagellar hook-associated protein 3 FlgL